MRTLFTFFKENNRIEYTCNSILFILDKVHKIVTLYVILHDALYRMILLNQITLCH